MSERALVWNFGGGTQSVAIAVLVAQGKLPRPERIVMADTGRENPETWAYKAAHMDPLLAALGLSIEVVPPAEAEPALHGGAGTLLLPAFDGDGGKFRALCSGTWKRDRVRTYLRSLGYGPKRPVVQWIGISVDEVGRAKDSDRKWCSHHWPLLYDVPLRRRECVKLVQDFGLPRPPKSSCYMCPNQSNEQWVQLRRNHPTHWQKAVELDTFIRERDTKGGMYLHASRVPLAEADLSPLPEPEPSLFGPSEDCESGYCFV